MQVRTPSPLCATSRRIRNFVQGVAAATLLSVGATSAHAALTLTQDGIDLGFSLSTFVSGYNFGNYGPLSQAVASNGNIITGSVGDGKVYVFKDVDNQTLGSAVVSTPYTCQTGNCNWALAAAGGKVYGAQLFGGQYMQFATDGSFTPVASLANSNINAWLGMWTNPVNQHVIASTNQGLVDFDPAAGTFRVVNSGLFPDGVSVTPDGKSVYVENGGTIQSYDLATGAFIAQYNTGHAPDGTGVIFSGSLAGKVVVNNNDGTVGLLDPSKPNGDPKQFVIIANGGSRGDFVSADTNNGTLFLSQVEQVARLSCGAGCVIGAPVPEPGTWAALAIGLTGLIGLRRRRQG